MRKKLLSVLTLIFMCHTLQAQFTCGNDFTDSRDGKQYATVQIGNQCWMAENLNFGTYKPIYGVSDYTTNNGIVEKFCYNNDSNNCTLYGGMYQWDELMNYSGVEGVQGICPSGWHVPTDAEYGVLVSNYPSDPAVHLQTGGTSGFEGLFGGYGYYNSSYNNWYFVNISTRGYLWTSTGALNSNSTYRIYFAGMSSFYSNNFSSRYALNVRCIYGVGPNAIDEPEKMIEPFVLKAFPNPVKDILTLEFDINYKRQLKNTEIVIRNSTGQEVNRVGVEIQHSGCKLSVSDLPQGIYFVNLDSEDVISTTIKVVKL